MEETNESNHGGKTCELCNSVALLRCNWCRKVNYCTREHQKKHWKQHKSECMCVKLSVMGNPRDPKVKEYYSLVALRDIREGEIVLKENAIVQLPFMSENFQVESGMNESTMCVSCQKLFTSRNTARKDLLKFIKGEVSNCPTCKLSMCSMECSLKELHSFECQILLRGKQVRDETQMMDVWQEPYKLNLLICLLRLINVRRHSAEKWNAVLQLLSKCEKDPKIAFCIEQNDDVIRVVTSLLKVNDSSRTQESIYKEVLEVAIVGYPVMLQRSFFAVPDMHIFGTGNLYELAGYIRHCCIPNATSVISEDGRVVVKAAIDIKKDGEVTLIRQGFESVFPPLEALQMRLFETNFYNCYCKFCNPTACEVVRQVNAVRCSKCSQGYLEAPLKFLDNGDYGPKWKCNSCNNKRTSLSILEDLKRNGEQYQFLLNRLVARDGSVFKDIEVFQEKLRRNYHPIHYLTLNCKVAHTTVQDMVLRMSSSSLIRAYNYHRELLTIYETIAPGQNFARGEVFFNAHRICELHLLRTILRAGPEERPWDLKSVQTIWKELHFYIKESKEILAWRKELTMIQCHKTIISCLERHSGYTKDAPFQTCFSPKELKLNLAGKASLGYDDGTFNLPGNEMGNMPVAVRDALMERLGQMTCPTDSDFDVTNADDQSTLTKLTNFFHFMNIVDMTVDD